MKINRILAGGLAALMAGATLAFGAFAATTIEDFVTVSDSTLSSPVIVVGDMNAGPLATTAASAAAKAEDTIAAADIAAAMAGYATKTGTCAAVGEGMAVSGGVDISTTNTKLYLADGLDTAKSTLTKSDMPTILASNSVIVSGTIYTYDQYISLGSQTVTFGRSGESIDPRMYIDMDIKEDTSPVYTSMVVFNKPLNISDTKVQGKTLDLFGSTYTIATGSASMAGHNSATESTLILFGAGITKTLDEDVPVTVDISGTEYTVEATYISEDNVLMKVNAETSNALEQDKSDVIGGLNLYVKTILYTAKTGAVSKVIVSLGTEKIKLKDTESVKLGQDETSVQNTLVALTGDNSGVSKLEIAVAAQKGTEDHIDIGKTYTDPVFKTFKVGFGGMSPAIDSAERSTIEVAPSGSEAVQLTMTDYRGNEATITFAYDNDGDSATVTPQLTDSNSYAYHVIEGEAVSLNDYVILAQGDFSHLFQLTDINEIDEPTANIKLTDVFSDDVITVAMDSADTYTSATFYVDGQEYFVKASADDAKFTWDATATADSVGTATTLFPYLRGENGELVAIVGIPDAGIPMNIAGGIYDVPGGDGDTGRTPITLPECDATLANCTAANASAIDSDAGRLTWEIVDAGDAKSLILNSTNGIGSDLTNPSYPFLIVLEEKGKDIQGNPAREAVIARTGTTGSETAPKMKVDANLVFISSAAITTNNGRVSNTYINDWIDRYGTYAVSNSYEQGLVTIYYPDAQAQVTVGFGADPSFSTTAGAEGTSYQEAVPITNAVAKFASEIPATVTSDLILIGGPCVNTLVAQLLEMSTASGDCYNEFVAAYPTKGVVKVIEDAFVTGKKALIIAGKTAADTRDLAANKVIKGTLDYAA